MPNKPSSLDAAYELEAIRAGLVKPSEADFEENRWPQQPKPAQNTNPPVWGAVIKDMYLRDREGFRKYKTHLRIHNGRDALQDAYEEALDLAVYLKQAIMERNSGA